jgi:GNAT superfamily N-acetyltransferase
MDFASETIEMAALQQLHDAAPAELKRRLGLRNLHLGSTLVSIAGALPDSAIVLNRTCGLGVHEPATEELVDDLLAAYRDAGIGQFFVHLHPDARPSTVYDWLTAREVPPTRGWQKFERGPGDLPGYESTLRVRPVGAEHGEAFARIACDGFDLGDAARPWLALLPTCPDWHAFVAFEGDEPAGTGALFIRGTHAWLDFAATAPAFRRRGCQGALLNARIAHALDAGCTRLFTCTGVAVPGDPQHSYHNILRAGFAESYVRANHAPSGG